MRIFVTAIHTDSGKTLASAIICRALGAAYWKPVQSGTPTDSSTVRGLLPSPWTIFPERFLLRMPASPHAAAKAEGIAITLEDFVLPEHDGDLVIEGAGGCLVPLNRDDFMIDLASHLKCRIVLVSNIYLGSINHTLLTVEAIRRRGLEIAGLIFNGSRNAETEDIILRHTGLQCLLRIDLESFITPATVDQYAKIFNENWIGTKGN